ncbi:MAG: zinc ribbon domain-containing protein [Bacillota bacterium]
MKRKIGQILCICIVVASIFFLSLSAYAAGTTKYTLDELGLSVSLPADYAVFTRDMDATDPNLAAYDLTKEGMSSLMTSRNIYLNAWDKNIDHEIVISMIPMTDDSLVDFNLYSDIELFRMATVIASESEHKETTFIKSEIYQQLKSIVDSTVFDTAQQAAVTSAAPASAFTYTDLETQTTFTVPANWAETALSKQREFIDVKFTSNEEAGMSIMYGSYDAWGAMTASERAGYTRSDMNSAFFTTEDVAEIYGISPSNIEIVTYGGVEYFKATVTTTDTIYGTDLTVTMTQLLLVNNGYMYSFHFSGTSDNEYYDDFEGLMESVKYKDHEAVSASSRIGSADLLSEFSLENILLSLVVTIAVYSLPIIIYRYAIKKEPVEPRKAKKITIVYGIAAFIVMSALIFTISGSGAAGGAILIWSYINYRMLTGSSKGAAEAVPSKYQASASTEAHGGGPYQPIVTADNYEAFIAKNSEKRDDHARTTFNDKAETLESRDEGGIGFCHKCGNKLESDSVFCHKCGAKIPRSS